MRPRRAPHIDWKAISPLVALVGGLCLVLMVGLLRAPFVRTKVVPFLTLVALGATAASGSGRGATTSRCSRAR